jgi:hypothetical protein
MLARKIETLAILSIWVYAPLARAADTVLPPAMSFHQTPRVIVRSPNLSPPAPVTNLLTGETLVPVGRNYIGPRDGKIYVPLGSGVIDPRTGKFAPTR